MICTGTFGPAEDALEKHFQLEAPFAYFAFFTCIYLGVKVEVAKYQIGKMEIKQRRQNVTNQNIPNQDSIVANICLFILYLAMLFFLNKMNK